MIVDNIHVQGVAVLPFENHAPLVVDPQTPESFKVSIHLLKPIARRAPERFDGDNDVQLVQEPTRLRVKLAGNFPSVSAVHAVVNVLCRFGPRSSVGIPTACSIYSLTLSGESTRPDL